MEINSLSDIDCLRTFSSYNRPVAIKGVKGNILFMNDAAKTLSRLSESEILDSYSDKLPADIVKINELGLISIEKKINEKFYHVESETLLDKFGLFYGTIFIFHDFTLLAKYLLNNKIDSKNKAYDEITGFFLKNQLNDILAKESDIAMRHASPLAIATFYFEDLAFFGQSLGEDKLNQLLKFYGIYFKQKFRKTDIFFRNDFNNFVCIMPYTNYKNANSKFDKLQKGVESVIKFPSNAKPILMFGISEFNIKNHYKNYNLLLDESKTNLENKKFYK